MAKQEYNHAPSHPSGLADVRSIATKTSYSYSYIINIVCAVVFTDVSKAVLLFLVIFVINVFVMLSCLLLQPCGHLLGKC